MTKPQLTALSALIAAAVTLAATCIPAAPPPAPAAVLDTGAPAALPLEPDTAPVGGV